MGYIADIIGGGIVFDSDPYDEWVETMNKLGANMQCISSAEKIYTRIQANGSTSEDTEAIAARPLKSGAYIDLAGG